MKKVPPEFFKYNNPVYNEKIYRLYRWMIGEIAPPYKFILVPTNRCNLKCFCCPNAFARAAGRFKEEEELTDEQWLSIVTEGLELGVKEWYILGGGEPMMRKTLVLEIVKLIKKDDFFNICEIITNGTLWTKDDVERIVKLKLDKLLVSIDANDATHDYLRNKEGAFANATQTLKYFKKYKLELRFDKPIVQINSVINNRNYNMVKKMIDYAAGLEINELALHPMREYEETKGLMAHLKLSTAQTQELNSQLIFLEDYAKKAGLRLNLSMIKETEVQVNNKNNKPVGTGCCQQEKKELYLVTRCFEPFYSVFIDPKGNANFCCAAGDGKSENNVIVQGIKKLWSGPFFSNIRSIIINNGKTEKCEACGLLDMALELRSDIKKYADYIQNEHCK